MPPLRGALRQGRLSGGVHRALVPVRLRVRGVGSHLRRLHAEGLRGRDRPRPAARGGGTAGGFGGIRATGGAAADVQGRGGARATRRAATSSAAGTPSSTRSRASARASASSRSSPRTSRTPRRRLVLFQHKPCFRAPLRSRDEASRRSRHARAHAASRCSRERSPDSRSGGRARPGRCLERRDVACGRRSRMGARLEPRPATTPVARPRPHRAPAPGTLARTTRALRSDVLLAVGSSRVVNLPIALDALDASAREGEACVGTTQASVSRCRFRPAGVQVAQLLHLGGIGAVAVRAGRLDHRRQALDGRVREERAQPLAELALERRSRAGRGSSRAAPAASLTCSARSRSRPIASSTSASTAATASGSPHVDARHEQVAGVEADAEPRVAGRARRRSIASSSIERPIVPPAPAEFSSRSHVVLGAAVEHLAAAPARTRFDARLRSRRPGASRRGRRRRPPRSRRPRRPSSASSRRLFVDRPVLGVARLQR